MLFRFVKAIPWLPITSGGLALGIFLLDVMTPRGIAEGILYVLVVLGAVASGQRLFTLLAAYGSTMLIVVGYAVSPTGVTHWISLTNRVLSLATLWAVAWLALQRFQKETQLQQAAVELDHRDREHTAVLQSILDSMGDGVVVADRQGRFLLFNPAAEQILKIAPTDVPPAKWSEYYGFYLPDMVTPYPPEDLPLARAIRGEAVSQTPIFVRHPKA